MFKNFMVYSQSVLALVFTILIFSIQSQAAVTIDNSNSYGEFNLLVNPTSLIWSHTVGTGNSRALYVTVSRHSTTVPLTTATQSVTYGGTALTALNFPIGLNSTDNRSSIQVFRLVNPPSETADIVVSLAGGSEYALGTSVSFNGVDQTNPNRSFFSIQGSEISPSVLVPDSEAGDMVLDVLAAPFNSQSFIAGVSQSVCFPTITETDCRRGRRFFGGLSDVGASSTKPANSPVTMSWTLFNSGNWVLGAVAIRSLPTTAAIGTIYGRVLSRENRGIPRVTVSLRSGNGEVLTARTNPLGYFRFDKLELGNTYVMQASSKQYVFAPQIISLNESLTEVNLIPIKIYTFSERIKP